MTAEVVWLTWTPNLEGGAPKGYTIRYQLVNESSYQVRRPVLHAGLAEPLLATF